MTKNPFNRIAEIAGCVGVLAALLAVVAFLVGGAVYWVNRDPHVLWQFPLTLVAFFVVLFGIGKLGELFAKKWRKWSADWDRKHGDLP